MQWLTDLLEKLSISRSAAGAMLITASVLFWGPKVLPEYLQPLPAEWVPAAAAIMVFSGTLLLFWLVAAFWSIVRQLTTSTWKRIRQQPLNHREIDTVLWLAESPTLASDIDELDYNSQPYTKLELMVLIDGLVDRELVEYVALNNLVILTPLGRSLALELQQRKRANLSAVSEPSDVGVLHKDQAKT